MTLDVEQASEESTDTLLERITRQVPHLRRSEQRVAAIVLDDPVSAAQFTMAGLAEAAEVSEPTVMRFCSSVGCEGSRTSRSSWRRPSPSVSR